MKVAAKTKEKPTPVEVEYDFGAGLDGMIARFGKDVVEAHAEGALVISLQAFIRRHIDKGSASEAIQAAVSAWKPDVRSAVKMTALDKASSQIDKLSADDRKALLAKLRALG